MKFGIRTPSLKRSISARTTGRTKRSIKRALIPGYGKKGRGWITNPNKAAQNKVYRKYDYKFLRLIQIKENITMTTDDKLLLVGKVLKVLLVILVFPILVVFELAKIQK